MSYHWSIHQLTEYLFAVSRPQDPTEAIMVALERAVEALDAEVGAVIIDGELRGSVGFGRQGVPEEFAWAAEGGDVVLIPGIGRTYLACGELSTVAGRADSSSKRIIVGRVGEECAAEEQQMLQGMALVLGLVLHNVETLQRERSRHQLVETLLAIQRAISARRPLQELLDAITAGASVLLGGCPIALLLIDPLVPGALVPASVFDYPDLDEATVAMAHRVMVVDATAPGAPVSHDQTVLAERVVVSGETAGCLVARSDRGRDGRRDHGELLTAFAQQVSLALTDARALDAIREAYHDSITGLPNRVLFLERVEQARRTALAQGHDLTVLFIDLDRFKAVNDTLGHRIGDDLLAEVGRRITASARAEDTAARLGGDEFAVLLERTDAETGHAVAERIVSVLARPFVLDGQEVDIGASVGIAPLTARHVDAGGLLSDADIAMYCAKRAGRGRSVVFAPHMLEDVINRLGLRTDLRRAHQNGQLWLAYQPIIKIGSSEIEGIEGLMRWSHPTRGLVPPGDFIPVAEETEAIIELGAWAIHQGLIEVEPWRDALPSLRLSLNLSARQIVDPDLPAVVTAALLASGLPATVLTLEITESLLMDDPDAARAGLNALKDLGIRLSIDDFGTGYSSLSYLRRFPVDQVKIDRTFIARLGPDADDDIAVVRSIIELCQRLRLETVAEGIETPEQLEVLADLGCDLGQGFLFARPMPPGQWHEYLRTRPTGVPTGPADGVRGRSGRQALPR